MKRVIPAMVMACVVIGLSACNGSSNKSTSASDDAHSSRNSLDWAGTYRYETGSINNNNDPGTVAVITLNADETYTLQSIEDRMIVNGESQKVVEMNGVFSWNKAGSEIELKSTDTHLKTTYKVGENRLTRVGEVHAAGFPEELVKIQPQEIAEKYWKLIELNGQPLTWTNEHHREPFIILHAADNRVNGNGGCNGFFGSYEKGEMTQISFSKMGATQMACLDMTIEQQLFTALETTDNYTISEDGKYLSLNRARMAPLARFEVVYLR